MKFIIDKASESSHYKDRPPHESAVWNDVPWSYSEKVPCTTYPGFWTIEIASLEDLKLFVNGLKNSNPTFDRSIIIAANTYHVPQKFRNLLWLTIYDCYVE